MARRALGASRRLVSYQHAWLAVLAVRVEEGRDRHRNRPRGNDPAELVRRGLVRQHRSLNGLVRPLKLEQRLAVDVVVGPPGCRCRGQQQREHVLAWWVEKAEPHLGQAQVAFGG